MKLHENISLYSEAVRFTSQQMNLKPEYVEKDYWITYALFTIFHNKIGEDTVFKGGTALSKCFHMIESFFRRYRFGRIEARRRNRQQTEIEVESYKLKHNISDARSGCGRHHPKNGYE